MAKQKETTIDILKLEEGRLEFCIVGRTPIILHRISQKTQGSLLFPSPRKTASEKASTLKHRPLEEYRDCPYRDLDENGPTALQLLATAFKKAMQEAALDIPDVTKSQIMRLVWVNGGRISLYGIPAMGMDEVRLADISRTPDIRTRMKVRDWACRLSVSFRKPMLREQGIANLLAASGVSPGVGDFRVGKGGDCGQFEIVSPDDERFVYLTTHCGRVPQLAAIDQPGFFDDETRELYEYYQSELRRRGFSEDGERIETAPKIKATKKSNGKSNVAPERSEVQ